jgi:hypothetical protein
VRRFGGRASTRGGSVWHRHIGTLTLAAQRALTFIGLATLLISGGRWLFNTLSMSDVAAIVRPICERYPFRDTPGLPVGFRGDLRLVGIQVFTNAPISGLRAKFTNLEYVYRWGFESNGLSQPEQKEFADKLPIGRVGSELITPVLPAMGDSVRSQLFALAAVTSDASCNTPDYAGVIGGTARVMHMDPTFFRIRGAPRLFLGTTANAAVSILATVLAAILLYGLFIRPSLAPKPDAEGGPPS